MDVFIRGVLEKKPVVFEKGGDHVWEPVHVKDTARGIIQAYKFGRRNTVYNIGAGKAVKFSDIGKIVKKLYPWMTVSIGPGPLTAGFPNVDTHGPSDISRARTDLNYVPQYDLEKGIAETVDYMLRRK